MAVKHATPNPLLIIAEDIEDEAQGYLATVEVAVPDGAAMKQRMLSEWDFRTQWLCGNIHKFERRRGRRDFVSMFFQTFQKRGKKGAGYIFK